MGRYDGFTTTCPACGDVMPARDVAVHGRRHRDPMVEGAYLAANPGHVWTVETREGRPTPLWAGRDGLGPTRLP